MYRVVLLCLMGYLLLGLPVYPQEEEKESQDIVSVDKEKPKVPWQKIGSWDFEGQELRHALRLIAEDFGLDIAIPAEVQGTVTARLKDVTLETALNTILSITKCDYFIENNIIIIIRTGKLKRLTRIFHLDHLDASSVKDTIKGMISPNGEILTFIRDKGVGSEKTQKRSNVLIITDIPSKIEELAKIIKELDTPAPQVLIEAKMIEINLDRLNEMGIDWTVDIALGGPTFLTTFPLKRDQWSGPYVLPGEPETPGGPEGTVLVAKENEIKAGTLSFKDFTTFIKLIQTKGPDVNIIARPMITTLDNQEARIIIGDVIPIPTYTYNEERGGWEISGYEEQNVGVTLNVTPHITPKGDIIMSLKPEVSEITGWVIGPSGKEEKPKIATRKADSQVRVKDNETIVIGGLIKTKEKVTESKVPLLGDIPILGWLFRSKSISKEKLDLLIFITPHILTDERAKEISLKEEVRIQDEKDKLTPFGPAKPNEDTNR